MNSFLRSRFSSLRSSRRARRALAGGALATALLLAPLRPALADGPASPAGDRRPVELVLDGGEVLSGVIESMSSTEVVLRVGPESLRPIPLDRLAPLGLFRARQALAPAADGEARLQLSELAVDLGLYAEARVELEKALALGAIKESAFDKALHAAETAAVEAGLAQARTRAEAGDLEGALDVARRLKLDFAEAPGAAEVGKLVQRLVDDIAAMEKANAEAQAELERIQLGARRAKEIFQRKTEALDLLREGRRFASETKAKQEQGAVTRARKLAEQADERFMASRRHLGRLRRILPAESPERAEVLQALNRLDREQFDLLFGMARFLYREAGVYTQAERFAARASYIDPVHPDLIELRDQLIAGRIRYRMSDVTNTHGTVTSR